jgi:hypothetical protein
MKQCSFNARGVGPIQATLLRGKVEERLEDIEMKEDGWLTESSLLAQRAASEGPRWTRAMGGQTARPAKEKKRESNSPKWKREGSLDGPFRSLNAHDETVLVQCAR